MKSNFKFIIDEKLEEIKERCFDAEKGIALPHFRI